MQEFIKFANELADIAGEVSRQYYRQDNNPVYKEAGSPIVTIADITAEEKMREAIEARYPDHSIIGEEHGTKEGASSLTWILDPVDGTIAFACGRPQFGNLIALMDGDEFLLGVISQPITNERWVGVKGQPTLFNGEVIRGSALTDLSKARMGCTGPERFLKNGDKTTAAMMALLEAVHVTSWGGDCYGYGLVACGYEHLFLDYGLSLYDYAPLIPIIEGADGKITDWQGNPLTKMSEGSNCSVIAATNPTLHQKALEIIQKA